MQKIKILGILVKDRIKEAGKTQKVLSEYSHLIKSRLGYHELSDIKCSRQAFVILHLIGNSVEWDSFIEELNKIGGIEVKEMEFNY